MLNFIKINIKYLYQSIFVCLICFNSIYANDHEYPLGWKELQSNEGWKLIKGYLVGPTANLQGADLSGANLKDTILKHTNFYEVNLEGANLEEANLDEVISGYIKGSPASLPDGWMLIGGVLIDRTN